MLRSYSSNFLTVHPFWSSQHIFVWNTSEHQKPHNVWKECQTFLDVCLEWKSFESRNNQFFKVVHKWLLIPAWKYAFVKFLGQIALYLCADWSMHLWVLKVTVHICKSKCTVVDQIIRIFWCVWSKGWFWGKFLSIELLHQSSTAAKPETTSSRRTHSATHALTLGQKSVSAYCNVQTGRKHQCFLIKYFLPCY